MATSVDQLLAHPGAKDLRLDTLIASLPRFPTQAPIIHSQLGSIKTEM